MSLKPDMCPNCGHDISDLLGAESMAAEQHGRIAESKKHEWQKIANAKKETGVEIIGTKWASGVCIREPFVSFWSPSLNKFYCDPTHFIPLPAPPTEGEG